ncbi:MAG: SPFH domain-containing protein [Candidatus Promineifilaceae bacterium]
MESQVRGAQVGRIFVGLVLLLVVAAILGNTTSFTTVEEDKMGIKIVRGRIGEVLTPGFYPYFGFLISVEEFSIAAVSISKTVPESLTNDNQPIGVSVSALALPPNSANIEFIRNNWSLYGRSYWKDPEAAANIMNSYVAQSIRICVSQRSAELGIIQDRGGFSSCISSELAPLAATIGYSIQTLTIDEVDIAPEVLARYKAITEQRTQADVERERATTIVAESERQIAEQTAKIRVEQALVQEESRQAANLLSIEADRIAAELVVIEQQKTNSLAQTAATLETRQASIASTRAIELAEIESKQAQDLAAVDSERAVAEQKLELKLFTADQNLEAQRLDTERVILITQADMAQLQLEVDAVGGGDNYTLIQIAESNANAVGEGDLIITDGISVPTVVVSDGQLGGLLSVPVAPAPATVAPN